MSRRTATINNATVLSYYLGSKQRMASKLVGCVDEVCDSPGRVIDLFSGMGSASVALAKKYQVVSVDIQEYARVMCSALITDIGDGTWNEELFYGEYRHVLGELLSIYQPLVSYEEKALELFDMGNGWPFSSVIENGCMLPEYRKGAPEDLRNVMGEVDARLKPYVGYDAVARYFGGTYFSYRQALELSAARACIDSVPLAQRDLVLAGIICSASRCASTVGGQFAQPLRAVGPTGALKQSALEKAEQIRNRSAYKIMVDSIKELEAARVPSKNNLVIRDECSHFLEHSATGEISAVYADPPYSRYHYSRYYHVLETIALGDSPQVTTNPANGAPSRGIYRAGRYQSPYSTRKGAHSEFIRLFDLCAEVSPSFVLSYSPYPGDRPSTPRMVTIEELVSIARTKFKSVEVRDVDGVVHSKLTDASRILDASKNAEVLILCKN